MKTQSLGQYTLHSHPLQLLEGGRVVSLSQRPLKVLALLAHAHGRVVTKERIFQTVWRDSIVEEGNLTQTIFLLRRTLGKLPGGGEFIETLPRRGYRLAAKALVVPEPDGPERSHGKGDANSATSGSDRLELLINAVEDHAIFMLDCAGRVLTWNLGAEKMFGYRAGDVIGQHHSLLHTPEDIAEHTPDRDLARTVRGGPLLGEVWRTRLNGDRFWAGSTLIAMKGPDTRLIGFAAVVRDLSGRKRQHDALLRVAALLRKERDRLRAAAECSLDAIFLCQALRNAEGEIEDFTFTYTNENGAGMMAVPREVLLSARMRSLPSVHRSLSFENCKQVTETGLPYVAVLELDGGADPKEEKIYLRAVRLGDGVFVSAFKTGERNRTEGSDTAVPSAMGSPEEPTAWIGGSNTAGASLHLVHSERVRDS